MCICYSRDSQVMNEPAHHNNDEVADLISKARTGDEVACASLYHHYVRPAYRLAYGVLLSAQDAEEVVQDSFVYAFRSLHKYDETLSSFKTWLYTITMSRCRNKRRRKWRPVISLVDIAERVAGNEPQPEEVAVRRGLREMVYSALGQLSPKLREAIVLRYFDGLTYREMAEVLQCPQKTAESRVRLGHEALYRILAGQRDMLVEGLLNSD